MSIRAILMEKDALRVELQELIAKHPNGDLPPEAESRSQELERRAVQLNRLESLQVTADDLERRSTAQQLNGSSDNRLEQELRSFSLVRAIAGSLPDSGVDSGREREISSELQRRSGTKHQGIAVPMTIFRKPVEQRVMTALLPSAGPPGALIGTDYMGGQFIDILRAQMVVRRLGCRVLDGLVGNVTIPKLKASATTGWVADNAALSASDQQYQSVTMTPKHAGGIVEFSRNMLLQTDNPSIEQLVRDDFAEVLARAADSVAIKGGGSNEPTGVMGTVAVDGTLSMATPTWTNVLQLIEKVEAANSEGSAFIGNASCVRKLRSTAKVTSTDSVMIMEGPDSLAGYPFAQTSLIPSDGNSPSDKTTLIFGNWSDLIMGFWSSLDVLVNPYESTAYSKGNVQIRAMMTMDIALRHTQSFAYSDDFGF